MVKILLGDSVAITKLITENENNIKQATIEGISGDAIEATLEDMVNISDSKGKIPSQVKDTVEAIVEMKKDTENKVDPTFASEFVKENNEKIKIALNEGISPKEVTTTLVNSTSDATNRKGKKYLNFIVRLISKMKKKELKLRKEKDKQNTEEKTHQYVYK